MSRLIIKVAAAVGLSAAALATFAARADGPELRAAATCSCDTSSMGFDPCSGPVDAGAGISNCPHDKICDLDTTCSTPSYTNNGNGTVTDNVTGLIWQKDKPADPCPAEVDAGSNGPGACKQKEAESYCKKLKLGGSADWKLPTLEQLYSLVDTSSTPSIDSAMFPDTATNDPYWTSSSPGTGTGWAIFFSTGFALGGESAYPAYVRCVR